MTRLNISPSSYLKKHFLFGEDEEKFLRLQALENALGEPTHSSVRSLGDKCNVYVSHEHTRRFEDPEKNLMIFCKAGEFSKPVRFEAYGYPEYCPLDVGREMVKAEDSRWDHSVKSMPWGFAAITSAPLLTHLLGLVQAPDICVYLSAVAATITVPKFGYHMVESVRLDHKARKLRREHTRTGKEALEELCEMYRIT